MHPAAILLSLALTGTVTNALTGAPVPDATVSVAGASRITGPDGRYRLPVPAGTRDATLAVRAPGFHAMTLVHQRPGREGVADLIPRQVTGLEALQQSNVAIPTVPWRRAEAQAIPGEPLHLDGSPMGGPPRVRYTTPVTLPATIKVAMRQNASCSGTITQIETLPIDDYVAGVVRAEIGVFTSNSQGESAAQATFQSFAVFARSYAAWYHLYSVAKGRTSYDIDNTACNQRYEDARSAYITTQVDATSGLVMVKAADPSVIDKYEYAASCGRYGTLPAYGSTSNLVPDATGEHGCVGSWCGHDTCAGHQDNPNLPAGNKCLVRGACQWGSLEWSMAGKSWQWIVAHYQPNLEVVDLSGVTPPADGGVGDAGDAGPITDAGPVADGGDAGAGHDAGPRLGGTVSGGCGCSAGNGGATGALTVLVLLVLASRRGRARG